MAEQAGLLKVSFLVLVGELVGELVVVKGDRRRVEIVPLQRLRWK